jgi:cytochrome c-type biogenesis protein CcmH
VLLYTPATATVSHAQSAPHITPAPVATFASTPIPISDDQVNAVARNLYCPVCENTPLEVCPTDACARWREQVRELLGQGETETQVRQYFIDHFGMRTVGTPTDPTSVLLTTGLPFGLILIAALLIVWQFLRWYRARPKLVTDIEPAPDDANSIAPDDYQARIEAELRKKG